MDIGEKKTLRVSSLREIRTENAARIVRYIFLMVTNQPTYRLGISQVGVAS